MKFFFLLWDCIKLQQGSVPGSPIIHYSNAFFHFPKAFKNYYIINQLSQNEVLCETFFF